MRLGGDSPSKEFCRWRLALGWGPGEGAACAGMLRMGGETLTSSSAIAQSRTVGGYR